MHTIHNRNNTASFLGPDPKQETQWPLYGFLKRDGNLILL